MSVVTRLWRHGVGSAASVSYRALSCLYQPRRHYNGHNTATSAATDSHVVDLRSDVLTQPTRAMMDAMATATTGDDVFREDPTVRELQDKTAEMFGMPAALFVPSGTMGNLISVLCHCRRRGLEVLFGHMAHMIVYEQGGVAQLGGVMPRTIPNNPDGTFDLDDLDSYIRPSNDPHQPVSALVSVENTHGNCGGKVLPLEFLQKLRVETNELGLPIHMDGARVLNAAVKLDVEPREILQHVDSVSVCLSKGVGAPIGSIIGGTHDLIEEAIRLRKVLGGGWRQPGPLAAAALVALQDYRQRLNQDHKHAQMFAEGVMEKHRGVVDVDVEGVQTNIVMINTLKPGLTAVKFSERLNTVTEEEASSLQEHTRIASLPFYKYGTRFITCHNHSTEDILRAVRKIHYVLDEVADD